MLFILKLAFKIIGHVNCPNLYNNLIIILHCVLHKCLELCAVENTGITTWFVLNTMKLMIQRKDALANVILRVSNQLSSSVNGYMNIHTSHNTSQRNPPIKPNQSKLYHPGFWAKYKCLSRTFLISFV